MAHTSNFHGLTSRCKVPTSRPHLSCDPEGRAGVQWPMGCVSRPRATGRLCSTNPIQIAMHSASIQTCCTTERGFRHSGPTKEFRTTKETSAKLLESAWILRTGNFALRPLRKSSGALARCWTDGIGFNGANLERSTNRIETISEELEKPWKESDTGDYESVPPK